MTGLIIAWLACVTIALWLSFAINNGSIGDVRRDLYQHLDEHGEFDEL